MDMRESRVLKNLREGKIVSCYKTNIADPRVTEMAAMFGYDCIWSDLEHIGRDWSAVENQVRAAKVYDADLMVRVARGSYCDYVRPLEMDAAGIMVPHIMNLEDAKKVVSMTKFHPIGRRALDGGNADAKYCNISIKDYIKQANEQRFVMIQIEDPEPLNELEAIVALDGIDIVFFGPGDFSQGIGDPGNMNNPFLIETRKRIAEVANKHGKYAGTVVSLNKLNEFISEGYKFLSIGADMLGLSADMGAGMSEFSKHSKK